MEMQKNVCNIVWVDDEIDTLLTDSKKNILKRGGFELIGIARTFKDFSHIMATCYDRIDAVITDANFNSESSPKSEKDLSGFVRMREHIHEYNQKRDIPFYLFTGRRDFLLEKYEDGELDYFEINNRYFTKGEFEEMLEQIRKDVEHINSPSFRIRKKYIKELEAAKLTDGNEECLMNALLYDYSEDWEKTQDYFNPMRKMVERIFVECKKARIVPENMQLSGWKRFLENKDNVYSIREGVGEIMPKPLIYSLDYFLHITQDGSHGDGDLELGIDAYVRENRNINLFRTVLYIAMDLCLWFEKYVKSNSSICEPTPKWKIKEDAFVCVGEVTKQDSNGKIVLVCENYLLGEPKNEEYSVGDTIGVIKETSKNRYAFSYKKKDGTNVNVDKYAISKDIVKLS